MCARRKERGLIETLDQQNLLVVIDLMELDLDNLATAGGHMLADVGGLNGQFAMAAVDKHGQLHATRPPVIEQCVESRTGSAPSVKHIVTQHYVTALDFNADGSRCDHRANIRSRQVVAVELY